MTICDFSHSIYHGPARLITKSYYLCEEGLSKLQINVPGEPLLYICDEDAVFQDLEPSENTNSPNQTTISQPPSEKTQPPNKITQQPIPRPNTATDALTIAKECPSDSNSYEQTNYIYSSL